MDSVGNWLLNRWYADSCNFSFHNNDVRVDDFVAFLQRCRNGLQPGGIICLKENICRRGFVVDREDASITRHMSIIAT